jgi:hypothetical protein
MPDYAAALLSGRTETPRAIEARTEVETIISEMCAAVSKELGRAVMVMLTGSELRARFGFASLAEDQGRVYILRSDWERARDMPHVHGVEVLTYHRTDVGYPVHLSWLDGVEDACRGRRDPPAAPPDGRALSSMESMDRGLEASLARGLRRHQVNARIWRTVKEFAAERPRS